MLGLFSESSGLRMGEVGLGFLAVTWHDVHILVKASSVLNVAQHMCNNFQVTQQAWDGMAGLASFVSQSLSLCCKPLAVF